VTNNGYLIQPGGYPVNRYSQGIQCTQSSLAITPFVTRGKNWSSPWYPVKKQAIYNDQTNEDGSLKYPGQVDYYNEQIQYPEEGHNLSYGITASFQIPLDRRFQSACLRAVKTNIEAQQLLITQTKLNIELNRLRICAEQARTGAVFVDKYKVSCEGIKVDIPPNQVIPHKHSISSDPSVLSVSQKQKAP
tara:strand:+ start:1654 stop:2223 length:570 start_codon:yes stop_codon:yes gene_type:complete